MQTVITNASFSKTASVLESEFNKLSDSGCFFAIIRTEYDEKGNVIHDFLEIIDVAIKYGYEYINTIVYPSRTIQEVSFNDNTKYVVWLCKNSSKVKFNKDNIREKHIWKDVEWGKRAKNYNPKGKDPGNVWIPTEDDGKANITQHILLDDLDVIERIISMSECGEDYVLIEDDTYCVNINRTEIGYNDIVDHFPESKVIFKSSEDMSDVKENSIKLVVTSPPYWNLKDYFKKGQIGQEDYETYLKRMKTVWGQCFDKLTEDGSLWININIRVNKGKVIPIPYDFVKMCCEIGFYYKGIIIWHKSSGIPTGDKNIVDRHEYLLLFSKKEDFNVDNTTFSSFADYKNDIINGGSFWNVNRKAGSVGKKYIHPAIYPNNLVERIIMVASNEKDIILDPFLGSGTSVIAAEKCNRICIGYEFNEGFRELMESRFNTEICDTKVEFIVVEE